MTTLPVVVVGAGPVGLAAAAHLLERGVEPLVLEAGDGPGAAVASWGHVRRGSHAETRRDAKCSPFERRRSNATACETGPS